MNVTNRSDIDLSLAVWLLHDEYDYNDTPNYISVTTLMRPIKQIILAKSIPAAERTSDVEDYVSRALGHSIHDSIEKAWLRGSDRSMRLLGIPQAVRDRVKVNPTAEEVKVNPDIIPVYIEQRATRELDGWIIGGKFDMVTDGIVKDNKSTSAWTWVFGTKDEDYATQLGCYKWLNPDKVTSEVGAVNFIFTDWSKMMARTNPKYPSSRIKTKSIALPTNDETQRWISGRLALIKQHMNSKESDLPPCNDKELWRSDPSYKYYKDPSKTARSTKNFDNKAEAHAHMASQGGVGIVKEIPGEVKACGYCPAFDACQQKDQYL